MGSVTRLYETSREQLADLLVGEPAYRLDQVWEGLYKRALRPAEMTDLPRELRLRLEDALPPSLRVEATQTADMGATVKWSWRLFDDAVVETVLMLYKDRATVCVSTQAGCAMACEFCATGQAGFTRNLSAGEILEQVTAACSAARPRRLSNVVFMGMGEPMANYPRVWSAIERIQKDMGISARRLTLSTVGIVPGIERLATESLPVNLAVSLHAANDELRDRLVPINRRYPLEALARSCARYVDRTGRRLSFEWALIDGVNDRGRDVAELAAYCLPIGAHVNLIPLNPTPGYPVLGTPRERVRKFRDLLVEAGVNATIRVTRGVEIDAACGQLAAAAASKQGWSTSSAGSTSSGEETKSMTATLSAPASR